MIQPFDTLDFFNALDLFNSLRFFHTLGLVDPVRSFDSLNPLNPLNPLDPNAILENLDSLPALQAVAGLTGLDPLSAFQVTGSGLLAPLDFLADLTVFDAHSRLIAVTPGATAIVML